MAVLMEDITLGGGGGGTLTFAGDGATINQAPIEEMLPWKFTGVPVDSSTFLNMGSVHVPFPETAQGQSVSTMHTDPVVEDMRQRIHKLEQYATNLASALQWVVTHMNNVYLDGDSRIHMLSGRTG